MRVIDVIPVQTSTGEIVAAQLEKASLWLVAINLQQIVLT
jgi:hypothetical protein